MVINNRNENALLKMSLLECFTGHEMHLRTSQRARPQFPEKAHPVCCFLPQFITHPHSGLQMLLLIKSVGNCVSDPLGLGCSSMRPQENE